MSGNESSKNKLLDTMRKTKEDSSSKADEKPADAVKKEQSKAEPKKNTTPKKDQKKSSDPFQSARRVWPD